MAGVIVAAFMMAASVVILSGHVAKRPAGDQNRWHLVAIEGFASEWPAIDFSDYESATTPLYHTLVAAVHVYVTEDVRSLRLAGATFTIGLLTTLALWVGRRRGWKEAIALCLPMVCSLYVFSAGAWLLPDNAAWWGVLSILLLALRPRLTGKWLIVAAIVLTLLTLTRQIHVWVSAALWAAAWMGDKSAENGLFTGERIDARLGRVAMAMCASVPAFLMLGYFIWLWDGLAPPMFQVNSFRPEGGTGQLDVAGGNPIIPGTILAFFGAFGVFFAGYLIPTIHVALRKRGWRLGVPVVMTAAGLLLAGIPLSTYDKDAGRWSGIWNIVAKLPTFADRSPVIIGLGAAGGLLAGLWFVALPKRERWIFSAAFAGFVAAQAVTALAWQRYYEPFLLLLLILMATTVARSADETHETPHMPAWAPIGPAMLAAILLGVTLLSLKS